MLPIRYIYTTRFQLYRRVFLVGLLCLACQLLSAQCRDNSERYLDGNKVRARIPNSGRLFGDPLGLSTYEVPRGSGITIPKLAGIWMGGYDPQNQLHVAASSHLQGVWDWYAGPSRDPVAYTCEESVVAPSDIYPFGIKRLSNGDMLILAKDEILIYDPVTRQTLVRPLPASRVWMDAIELPDGRIFIFGDDLYPTKNPVLFMDTVNYAITGGPTLNWFHQESSVDLLDNGRVLLAGVVGCEVFDPVTNLSAAVPDMLWPRRRHGTCKLPNGDIFACGGGATLNAVGQTAHTQIFNDTLGYWFPGPSLSIPRQRASATRMPDGKVWISGGNNTNLFSEYYDPAGGGIQLLPALFSPAEFQKIFAIDTQQVLVASDEIFPEYGSLYKFNIMTGEVNEIMIQRSGVRAQMMAGDEILVETDDARHLQRLQLQSGVQDDDRWQYVWKVDRQAIDDFKADFLAGQVDFSLYPDIATWPAHGNVALGEDRVLAPFVDVNGDGFYRPAADGDYPCIVGDQALWWVINDQGPHESSGGRPLGMQIEVMAYVFDCNLTPCPDTSMDYSVFFHYEFTNKSDTLYHDLYVGNQLDFELGNWQDDYVGCDSSRQLAFGFNADSSDSYFNGNPPAWGSAIMPNGGLDTMAAFVTYNNDLNSVVGAPFSPDDYYDYMMGQWKDATPIVNNGLDGYVGTAPGPVSPWMYGSTAGFCSGQLSGWSEFGAANVPGQRRLLQSAGPFSLVPGQHVDWDLGLFYARDQSNLLSVCRLQAMTTTVQDWWKNQLDRSCWSTLVAARPPQPAAALHIVPNPVDGPAFAVAFGSPLQEAGSLELMDLNGRVLQQWSLPVGADRQEVDAARLPAGVYLLRLTQPGSLRVQRVVVW